MYSLESRDEGVHIKGVAKYEIPSSPLVEPLPTRMVNLVFILVKVGLGHVIARSEIL